MENLNLQIPLIGLGTYQLENVEDSVIKAIKIGYRLIDTASFYENEEQIGKAIKHCIDNNIIKRNELFIVTKLWNDEKENPEEAIKRALSRLQLDYIDLYLVHWPIGKVENNKLIKQYPLHHTWSQMEKLVEQGLTRFIGVSNFSVQLLLDLISYANIAPYANQVELHPYCANNDLHNFCKMYNIKLMAYNPILRGISTRKRNDYDQYDLFKKELILEIAEKYKKTPAQIILNWVVNRGIVAIPKSSNEDRQKENLESLNFKLEENDYEKINSLNKEMRFNETKTKFFCAGINLFA